MEREHFGTYDKKMPPQESSHIPLDVEVSFEIEKIVNIGKHLKKKKKITIFLRSCYFQTHLTCLLS